MNIELIIINCHEHANSPVNTNLTIPLPYETTQAEVDQIIASHPNCLDWILEANDYVFYDMDELKSYFRD